MDSTVWWKYLENSTEALQINRTVLMGAFGTWNTTKCVCALVIENNLRGMFFYLAVAFRDDLL